MPLQAQEVKLANRIGKSRYQLHDYMREAASQSKKSNSYPDYPNSVLSSRDIESKGKVKARL